MPSLTPGQVIGRGDLDIFLVDSQGGPTNAAEIYYALFFVDPGPPEVEVLIGPAQRTPVNPQIGEYYAALQVPGLATLGTYRIRWYFREYVSQPLIEVVQEFQVVDPAALKVVAYSDAQWSMINKLRMLLRDQCLAGEEKVPLLIDGCTRIEQSLETIWETQQDAISAGRLQVLSTSSNGDVEWKRVLNVHRAEVPWETIYSLTFSNGKAAVMTAGHRVYVDYADAIEAQELSPGDDVLGLTEKGLLGVLQVQAIQQLPSRQYMYDLTVEDNHNLVLADSGVIVHNCPDKFYHFRPPEHEGSIGKYNRVFGQIWEDAELLEYLERALDWYNTFPPATPGVNTLDLLVTTQPSWRTAIIWGAIAHACFALAINWVADEFSYTIGGVSLDIEKSAKYESLKQNAESMFDKATEAKARTVKFIRGLQQSKYGLGVRSSFGPFVGRGVLSPRSFVVLPYLIMAGTVLTSLVSGMGQGFFC